VISAAEITFMEIGVFCSEETRFSAVTTTSARPPSAGAAEGSADSVWAAARAPHSAHMMAKPTELRFMIFNPLRSEQRIEPTSFVMDYTAEGLYNPARRYAKDLSWHFYYNRFYRRQGSVKHRKTQ
jgi:hypothetical protein